MKHDIFILLSIFVFVASAVIAIYIALFPYKKKKRTNPFYIFIVGVFLSEVILFFPFCQTDFDSVVSRVLSTLLASVHTAIRLFLVDCDFAIITDIAEILPGMMSGLFAMWGLFLIVLSPLLTAGAALSFLVNVSAHTKYWFGFFKDTYIFSELNEYSLALASSLKQNDRSRMIVFADVYEKTEEAFAEISEKAKEIDAVLFKSDITTTNFRVHSKKKKLYFFIMGSDEEENFNQTAALTAEHSGRFPWFSKKGISGQLDGYDYDRGDTRLYLFTSNFSSELQIRSLNPKYMRIRRIKEGQSLVYKLLYDHGMQIFDSARETGNTVYNAVTEQDDKEKRISAMVIGLGSYGTEMVRALAWFGQMHPYRIEITAFDANPNAAEIFRSDYPELFDFDPMNERDVEDAESGKKHHNGDFETPGESHYKITINGATDVKTYRFDQKASAMSETTYVFVSLGDDNVNIKVATKMRILFRRMGIEPVIHTIIYNPNNQDMLVDDYSRGEEPEKRNTSLRIMPFGAISSNYSEDCVLNSDIEQVALERHMKYVYKDIEERGLTGKDRDEAIKQGEESFWGSDYNYRSSIASAIHTSYKRRLNIPGIEKAPNDRTDAEWRFCSNLEHQRWNAYVRSEGYVKAEKRDKLIKTHHLLIPFDELPPSEQIKDDD